MAKIRNSQGALALLLSVAVAPAFGAVQGTPPAATSAAPPASTTHLPGKALDEVVAVVNNKPILESSLDEDLKRFSAALQARGTPLPPRNIFRHQVLERLITQSLELQAANQQGIQISDDDVNRALSRIAKSNNLTLAQLPQALAQQGENYAAFRRMIHDQLVIHQLEQQSVAANIDVTPSEIDHYLQSQARSQNSNMEYHIAQILIPFPSNPTPQQVQKTLAKANDVRAKLAGGANFASTAVAVSAGPHALQGGDIGWLKAAQLPSLFADAVPDMKPGSISDPIEGAGGYHIVKLLGVRKQGGKATMTMQYHVEHILLRPNPVRNLAQCKALAERLRKEIQSGKVSFSDAAKQYSDDPNSAGNGGDLGWLTLAGLPPAFAQAVKGLPDNRVSQPVRSQYGWHLIEVLGKREANKTKEEQRHEAYQAIFQRKLNDQLAEFKRNLRDQAYIKILDPADAGSDNGQ